jgi:hypothetical protein
MRILVTLPTLEGGGAERVMVDLAAALTRMGVPTDVCVVRRTGPLTFEAQKQIQLLFGTSRNWRMRYLFPTALKAIISVPGRYDVIVGGLDNTMLLAWLAGPVRRRPVVGVVHTDLRRSMKDIGSPLLSTVMLVLPSCRVDVPKQGKDQGGQVGEQYRGPGRKPLTRARRNSHQHHILLDEDEV